MTRLLIAGQAVSDFVFQMPTLPQAALKYRATGLEIVGGGIAANAAVAAARLGANVSLLTRLGNDQAGALTKADLVAEKVDLSLSVFTHGATSPLSAVHVDGNGERMIVNFSGEGLAQEPPSLAHTPHFDAVLVDIRWPKAAKAALDLAKRQNIPAIVDAEAPAPREVLLKASHIAFSAQGLRDFAKEEELEAALNHAAHLLPDAWICVTDGANGAYVWQGTDKINHHIPAFEITPIDTLGAGDVWHGAFALMLAEGKDPLSAIRFAHAVAALKCGAFGGRRATPDRQTTEKFLASQQTGNRELMENGQ